MDLLFSSSQNEGIILAKGKPVLYCPCARTGYLASPTHTDESQGMLKWQSLLSIHLHVRETEVRVCICVYMCVFANMAFVVSSPYFNFSFFFYHAPFSLFMPNPRAAGMDKTF